MADDPDDLYRKHKAVIEAVIKTVCREFRFRREDAEDFGQEARLRLVNPETGVFRKFENRSSLPTYVYVVVKRWAIDWVRQHGKERWRPPKPARDYGSAGSRLHKLITRDGVPLEQALAIVLQEFPGENPDALRALAAGFRLPPRPEPVDVDPPDPPSGAPTPEQQLIDAEEEFQRDRVKERIAELITQRPPLDRLVFRLRFQEGETVANIARTLKTDQKALYRRLDDIVKWLRKILKDEGLL